MQKSKAVKTMTIFCHRCDFVSGYSKKPPLHCPKCKWHKLSFEKDAAWNPLCWQWACANGYSPSPRSSLTQWFFLTYKIEEWEKFKSGIQDYETIGPPPNSGDSSQVVSFWWDRTGLKPLVMKAIQALLGGLMVGPDEAGAEEFLKRDPKITSLLSAYLSYWKRKRIIN